MVAVAEPLVGVNHPRVSRVAAARARLNAIKVRERIEAYVLSCGRAGATSDEICMALDLGPQSVSARLLELRGEAKNVVLPAVLTIARKDGKALTRPTGSGCPARVHVHVVFGTPGEQLDLPVG